MQRRANLITFYIGSFLTLTAEEGMTMGEWLSSEYNTVGAYSISFNKIMFPTISRTISEVAATVITDGKLYTPLLAGGAD